MDPLRELRQRRTGLVADARALYDTVTAESRSLNEAEQTRFDSLMAQADALRADIERLEQLGAAEEDLRQSQGAETVTTLSFPPLEQSERQTQGFRSFGEFLQAVYGAARSPHRVDPRLVEARAITGANETVSSDGGFLVQQDFATEIMSRMYQDGEILSRVRRIPLSGNSNGIKINAIDETSRATGSRWGGVQSYWVGEGDTVADSRPKFRQIALDLKKLMALFYATDELLADAAALEAVARQAFTEEFIFMGENAIVSGLGAGQPLGILNSGCLVTVSKETGQLANTLVVENIVKMWSRMYGRSRPNAVWLINQEIEPQLLTMGITVGTGGSPIYMPAGGLSAAPFATLMGRPVIPVEYCSALGTVGDIILADFSQYATIEKDGMSTDSSIHVRFIYDETVFRFRQRLDGQPTWNAALTPFKGSNTLSPFVTLATRA